MNRSSLIDALKRYHSDFKEEASFVPQFLELLLHQDAFQRDHLPGHITGSSWILDKSRQFVLLVHHGTLNRWMQPGGHADGEEDVLNVALREAREETGLKGLNIVHDCFFDLDIHPIPRRMNFPDHLHYDIRFLFEADKTETLIVSDESHDVAWFRLDELNNITDGNISILRMAEKTVRAKP